MAFPDAKIDIRSWKSGFAHGLASMNFNGKAIHGLAEEPKAPSTDKVSSGEAKVEFVNPETLSVTHIFDGEEVVTGGDDGQVWIATFANKAVAESFCDQQRQYRSVAGERRVVVRHKWSQPRPTQEVYHSSTLGRIPLSFTGRRLMQNLREAFGEFLMQAKKQAVAEAVTSQAYTAPKWDKVSEARGEIAKYMSKLEKGLILVEDDVKTVSPSSTPFSDPLHFRGMTCTQNPDRTWSWKSNTPAPWQWKQTDLIYPSPEKQSADLAAALAHHRNGNSCEICRVIWPCNTAKYFLREPKPSGYENRP